MRPGANDRAPTLNANSAECAETAVRASSGRTTGNRHLGSRPRLPTDRWPPQPGPGAATATARRAGAAADEPRLPPGTTGLESDGRPTAGGHRPLSRPRHRRPRADTVRRLCRDTVGARLGGTASWDRRRGGPPRFARLRGVARGRSPLPSERRALRPAGRLVACQSCVPSGRSTSGSPPRSRSIRPDRSGSSSPPARRQPRPTPSYQRSSTRTSPRPSPRPSSTRCASPAGADPRCRPARPGSGRPAPPGEAAMKDRLHDVQRALWHRYQSDGGLASWMATHSLAGQSRVKPARRTLPTDREAREMPV